MTKARKTILDTVEDSPVPLSASEIHKKITRPMDLVTVYRSLKYLEDNGFLESFSFTCTDKRTERYYYRRREPHVHFFHCEQCHTFLDLGKCELDTQVIRLETQFGVRIATHTLYFTGICARCLNVRESADSALGAP
ncbi:MAG: transcriptional repressor [Spirochaetes bacterium]|nr:transcriptional repressor [Spirochaetota bacterium]